MKVTQITINKLLEEEGFLVSHVSSYIAFAGAKRKLAYTKPFHRVQLFPRYRESESLVAPVLQQQQQQRQQNLAHLATTLQLPMR